MREITASSDMGGLIDRGADVDVQVKNLTVEDKGIKAALTETLSSDFDSGETSLKFKGSTSAAVISATEKMTIVTSGDDFGKLKEAVDNGLLLETVAQKRNLVVPPGAIDTALDALKAAGIKASVKESLTVKAADVRILRASQSVSDEENEARAALETCLKTDVSYRVKYVEL